MMRLWSHFVDKCSYAHLIEELLVMCYIEHILSVGEEDQFG